MIVEGGVIKNCKSHSGSVYTDALAYPVKLTSIEFSGNTVLDNAADIYVHDCAECIFSQLELREQIMGAGVDVVQKKSLSMFLNSYTKLLLQQSTI